MRRIILVCLVTVLIGSSVGAVLAKGGQGKQQKSQYSPPLSKQEDQAGEPGSEPDGSWQNRDQERSKSEQRQTDEPKQEVERRSATAQFRERFMEQVRLRLPEECAQEDRAYQYDEIWSGDMEGLAYRAEQRRFSPEETAGLVLALGSTARSGISNRFSEAIAFEGIDAGHSAALIGNALQLMERLHQEFRCPILSGENQDDGDRLTVLAQNIFRLRLQERTEEQLRERLRDGCSLEEAVIQLLL